MEAVIFIGIQATGKSTFYKERFFHSHVRINLDQLRTRHRERLLLNLCLETGLSFVVDNTNPSREERKHYILGAKQHGFEAVGYYFQSKIELAKMRNANREGKQCIPEKGILNAYNRLVLPDYSEGFDSLYYVSIDSNKQFQVVEWQDEVR